MARGLCFCEAVELADVMAKEANFASDAALPRLQIDVLLSSSSDVYWAWLVDADACTCVRFNAWKLYAFGHILCS